MLVVKIEIWPGGNENHVKELGRICISNLSELADRSDYQISLIEWGQHTADAVLFNHKHSDGWFKLLKRSLPLLLESNSEIGKQR